MPRHKEAQWNKISVISQSFFSRRDQDTKSLPFVSDDRTHPNDPRFHFTQRSKLSKVFHTQIKDLLSKKGMGNHKTNFLIYWSVSFQHKR